ncbi:M20 family metallo-hydrolase [Fervidibacillus albus]|uniref:M20 family metallo-hydrolase n=1 Tax=Fervidibacillus albus TaxID=2980026 RepID=A0A9E8RW28_9BACI|nr:M20 family metallo-hydrolase [Fervidibacillus albus]WAA09854.1 M20 family metallo-hydrolase [Fervidibacillus albus]
MSDLLLWLEKVLLTLNVTNSMEQKNGFTRLAFSNEEKMAHEQFRKLANDLQLKAWQDEVGNQWALWEVDSKAPTIGIGSHLDTVIEGGGYDGVAGIACALGAIRELKRKKIKPKKNIAVLCFISEESARFGVSTIGSKTIIGDVDKQKWEKITDANNITIRQAMENYGIDWETFENAYCEDEKFESFIELHIEQGRQLEKRQKKIGIVQGISTPIRLKVTAIGEANHSGTTLMNERKDALVAISPLIQWISKEAIKRNEQSNHLFVATVSTVNVYPNAMNVIPGKVEFGIDIRSTDDELKKDFVHQMKSYCKKIEEQSQVEILIDVLVNEESVLLDRQIQDQLAQTCEKLRIPYLMMNSGAGHDVMNMAKRWPAGLIFIPSVNGISHHPKEYTPLSYLETGVHVLTTFLENEVRSSSL